MDRGAKNGLRGQAGVNAVEWYFARNGSTIDRPMSVFDNRKDLLIDGKTVEVKTQTPYIKKQCFTFEDNQLLKVLAVDRMFFVSVPGSFRLNATLDIYEWPKDRRNDFTNSRYAKTLSKYGKTKIHIPLSECVLLGSCNEPSIVRDACSTGTTDYGNYVRRFA